MRHRATTWQCFSFNIRFPGQYFDVETGLNYNYKRDYDPATDRYVESDPIGLRAGVYSTYSYADGNPVSNADPLGLCKIDLRFKPIPFLGKAGIYHAYVVTTDPNGSLSFFRGGPEGVPNLESWIFGDIHAEYGAYGPRTADWTTESRPSKIVYDDGKPCTCENKRFTTILDAINSAHLPYYLERENSNSVVGSMLRGAGFSVGSLPVFAPAFNTSLD